MPPPLPHPRVRRTQNENKIALILSSCFDLGARPADTVRGKLSKLESSFSLLAAEIAFNEQGFVARHGEFFHGSKQINIEDSLAAGRDTLHPSPFIRHPSQYARKPHPTPKRDLAIASICPQLKETIERVGSLTRGPVCFGAAVNLQHSIRDLNLVVKPSLVGMGPGVLLQVTCLVSETLNPKPETLNPKPETRNPKPETRNPPAGVHSWAKRCDL